MSRGGASPTAFEGEGIKGLGFDGLLDLGEVRHGARVALDLGVHDQAVLVGHEDGALGDVEEAELLGDHAGVLDLEGLEGDAVEVGDEGLSLIHI